MKCIHCNYKDTQVKNSRPVKGSVAIWRRRYCAVCDRTFTTTETAFADNLFVIKSSKRRQRFVYEKLFASVFYALTTKKYPDSGDAAILSKSIARSVIDEVVVSDNFNKNISTSILIEIVYKKLKAIDQAYADHYIYYSPYRRKIGEQKKLIKLF